VNHKTRFGNWTTAPLLVFLLALGSATAPQGRAESLAERYAAYGQLIVTQMVNAPFPHPKRAEGHTRKESGKDVLYSAAEHYSNSAVAVFVPKGLRETGRLDFVVHFHGWRQHLEGVLGHYKLIEQLSASGRNAVLVVPQGPLDAPDSFGGKLEDPEGFKRFLDEAAETLRQSGALKKKDFVYGKIILSGHSGGYQVISSILDRGGLTDHVAEVWLFDALYAQTDKFLAWLDQQHGRLVDIYTEHGGTKQETEQLMATLKKREAKFFAGQEEEANADVFKANRILFLFTALPHDDVVDKHQTFRELLESSCLEAL
jgi:hypothetical protein